jgi:glycosyltransferase involved in cell wall biosynthesis
VRRRKREGPELSLVVVCYEMAREIPRTVRSLARPYQRGVESLDYEIIVVDNGSETLPDVAGLQALAPGLTVVRAEGSSASPARAVNQAVAATRGRYVGIVLDGARMVTPGVLALARSALAMDRNALATPMAWHLGPDSQARSRLAGYDAAEEDRLLNSIDWPVDGYRLFEIATPAPGANPRGFGGPMNESCCTFLSRDRFEALGGYDESFISPGGGYVNLDFFIRSLESPGSSLVVLLGEGSFHQVHGGAASNASDPVGTDRAFAAEYERIKAKPYIHPEVDAIYLGRMSQTAARWIAVGSEGT